MNKYFHILSTIYFIIGMVQIIKEGGGFSPTYHLLVACFLLLCAISSEERVS